MHHLVLLQGMFVGCGDRPGYCVFEFSYPVLHSAGSICCAVTGGPLFSVDPPCQAFGRELLLVCAYFF